MKQCVACILYPLLRPQKILIDSLNKQERVSPSLYGHYNTIAFQCCNTNSKRCPCSLFFHRETQETRIELHWCINQRFRVQVPFDFVFDIFTTTTKTYNVYWVLCLSTNLKRKRKEEIKYAWHCAFRKKTTEMAGRVVLWWPMLIGRWEKPT